MYKLNSYGGFSLKLCLYHSFRNRFLLLILLILSSYSSVLSILGLAFLIPRLLSFRSRWI